jgi:hypothetical protein
MTTRWTHWAAGFIPPDRSPRPWHPKPTEHLPCMWPSYPNLPVSPPACSLEPFVSAPVRRTGRPHRAPRAKPAARTGRAPRASRRRAQRLSRATATFAGSPPLLNDLGEPTGIELCEDGSTHRASDQACSAPTNIPACAGTEDEMQCSSDSECTQAANRRCASHLNMSDGSTLCGCVYICTSDSDCGEGFACLCAGDLPAEHNTTVGDYPGVHARYSLPSAPYPHCVRADCNTDADCPSGECGIAVHDDGCGPSATLACRLASDACRSHEDCAAGSSCTAEELPNSDLDIYQCRTANCMPSP